MGPVALRGVRISIAKETYSHLKCSRVVKHPSRLIWIRTFIVGALSKIDAPFYIEHVGRRKTSQNKTTHRVSPRT